MKKFILSITIALILPITGYCEKVKVDLVTEGTLEAVVSELDITNITELEITGRFTSADIIYLRKAQGKVANLAQLDLSGVTLVESDEPYNTQNEVAPDHLFGSTLTRYYYLSNKEIVEYRQSVGKMGGMNYYYHHFTMSLAGAFQDMLLEKIVLPESMKKIGPNCFKGCKILETVVVPTNVETIEWNAFLDNVSLKTIDLENVKEIGDKAFGGCTSLPTVNMVNLEKLDHNAFKGCTSLTDVNLPKLAEIPNRAFDGCTSLSEVTLSDIIKTIGDNAFRECSALEQITMPKELETIGKEAFRQSGLKSAILPNKVKKIGNYAFSECEKMESVTLSNSLDTIGNYAFSGCSLKEIELPSNLTYIGDYAFENCPLSTIEFPASLQNIGNYAFKGTSLESVTFTKGEGGLVIGVGAFHSIYDLKSVSFAEGLETIGSDAFRHCSKISSIELPEGLKSIGSYCFYECYDLTSVELPSTLHYVGLGAFNSTPWVKEQIAEDDGILYYGSVAYSYTNTTDEDVAITVKEGTRGFGEYFASGKKINAIEFPSTTEFIGYAAFSGTNVKELVFNEGLEEISESAFEKCSQLEDVQWPTTIKSIGKYAFQGCTSLKEIVIPENVEQLGISGYGAFDGCSGITMFTLNAKKLSMDSRIGKLESLAKLIIGSEVEVLPTQLVTTSGEMRVSFEDRSSESTLFIGSGCLPYNNMTTLSLPNCKIELNDFAFSNVSIPIEIPGVITVMGERALYNCGVTGNIRLSEDITSLGDNSFSGSDFTSISLPNTIMSIGESAFSNCTNLSSIVLPDKITAIEAKTFMNCISLTSISIPTGVTAIGESAFGGCSNLDTLVLPESLTSIGPSAFSSCSSLISISMPGVKKIEDGTFNKCNSLEKIGFGSGISEIKKAFVDCYSLSAIHISDLASWCNVSFEDYDANPLYYAKHLFLGDEEATDIVIPEGVEKISKYAFIRFDGLKSVVIPEGVTSIEERAFALCDSLTEVTIPSTVTSIGEYVFGGSDNIQSFKCYIKEPVEYPYLLFTSKWDVILYVPKGSKALYESADGWKDFRNIVEMESEDDVPYILDEENKTATLNYSDATEKEVEIQPSVTIDGEKYEVTAIGDGAFENNTTMEKVTIPESVTSIGEKAFAGCTNLKVIYLYAENPIDLTGKVKTRGDDGEEAEVDVISVFDGVNTERQDHVLRRQEPRLPRL